MHIADTHGRPNDRLVNIFLIETLLLLTFTWNVVQFAR